MLNRKGRSARSARFTRAQRDALASCYWQPCKHCGEVVPVLKGVGSPWAWHRCSALGFKAPHHRRVAVE